MLHAKTKQICQFLKMWDFNTLYIPVLYIIKGEVIMVKVKSLHFLIHKAPLNQPNTIMGTKFKHYGKKKQLLAKQLPLRIMEKSGPTVKNPILQNTEMLF